MAKLIYCMITSLDGYTEDAQGRFDWGISGGEPVLAYINELCASVRTYLYGRRIYETMLYWETAPTGADQSAVERDFTLQWKSARKFVYSRTLTEPRSADTFIERKFDADAIRRLKAESAHDISVNGPELAAPACNRSRSSRIPSSAATLSPRCAAKSATVGPFATCSGLMKCAVPMTFPSSTRTESSLPCAMPRSVTSARSRSPSVSPST